jgi:hypothetical protein
MKSIILLIVGIILIGTGVSAFFIIGVVFESVSIEALESLPFDLGGLKNLLRYVVVGVVGGLGVIFILIGLIGLTRRSKKRKQSSQILQTGADAEATVTFVDKNYSYLVNRRPIYSIVEYTYKDTSGKKYTNRIENVNSEKVVRNKIQVGTKIAIKYSTENPNESVIVM